MKHLSRTLHTLAVLTLLAAIWLSPWWAWLLTGLLLLIVGAATAGQAEMQDKRGHDYQAVPLRDGETRSSTGDPDLDRVLERPISDDDVRKYRRTYGRKADDQ